jgi:release factor glutamine methyltransferase
MSFVSVRDALGTLTDAFRKAGLDTPELDARLLALHACNMTREAYFLAPTRLLTEAEQNSIVSHQQRRLAREPVSRILGYREFWGRRFAINPAVLDPRPDTETLVELALSLAKERSQTPLNIIDLGTGSGCILLAILAELPNAWGIGVDRDEAALQIARTNAERLGLGQRAAFVSSNWTSAINGSFSFILTNPPYIVHEEIATLAPEVRYHDPHLALDGGADGLDAYRCILNDIERIVAPEAWFLSEIGAGQASGIIALFKQVGWNGTMKVHRDLAGVERVVAIMRQEV